ncbi:MAG: two-component system sensor histidine kinase NtrB, partial [Pseudomonadota bacterium]
GMQLEDFNKLIGFKGTPLTAILNSREKVLRPQEISFYTFEGKKLELLNYMAPIVNVEDEIIGAISICSDITEIKKQHHIMQQQEKLAMIGQMAAGIVHEIKNPLATIKGLSQLISYKANEVKVKEYSEVINSAIDDITKVVNEFLSFAKPKPTVIAKTTINKIVESMQLITETQCYTKNIKSRFNYSSCPMEITADEIKIKQVILNITENAIVAMENTKAPELVVSTYYDSDKSEGVIRISDNGIGMRPEIVEKLGTPFFTTKEKGTGLGLGVSYQIMNEHKGRIEVESMEGIGTVFRIIFTQIEDML